MSSDFPRTPSEWFKYMSPETRDRVLAAFEKFAYEYATATAMGYQADGKRMPWKMTPEMQETISAASYEVAMKILSDRGRWETEGS